MRDQAIAFQLTAPVQIPELPESAPQDMGDLASQIANQLVDHHLEVPQHPTTNVDELLARDLLGRKPFTETGSKGFRDALIWLTIQNIVTSLPKPETQVVFVTNNRKDFCGKDGRLHADLQAELTDSRTVIITPTIEAALDVPVVRDVVERLLEPQGASQRDQVRTLVDEALQDLNGEDLDQALGESSSEGYRIRPLHTVLEEPVIELIEPEWGTLKIIAVRGATGEEVNVRVTVEADCTLEGFLDRWDFFPEHERYDFKQDWNEHTLQVSEVRRAKFIFGGRASEADLSGLELIMEDVVDKT